MRLYFRLIALAAGCAAIALVADRAVALTVQLTTNPIRAYTGPDFGTEKALPDLGVFPGSTQYLEFEVHVAASNLSGPDEAAFGGVEFNITKGPGVNFEEFGTGGPFWNPNTEMVALPPAGPAGDQPLWETNEDLGPDDFVSITALVAGNAGDNAADTIRPMIGQPGGKSLIGTFYAIWDGITQSSLTVTPVGVVGLNLQNNLLVNRTSEPTTSMLAGVLNLGGGGGVDAPVVDPLNIVNDTLNATVSDVIALAPTSDPADSWSPTLTFMGYTQNYGGKGETGVTQPAVAPTWDPLTQTFTWDTTGSLRGDYMWKVIASNAGGDGEGLITVAQRAVPEPATLSLLGLALVGFVGAARRRS